MRGRAEARGRGWSAVQGVAEASGPAILDTAGSSASSTAVPRKRKRESVSSSNLLVGSDAEDDADDSSLTVCAPTCLMVMLRKTSLTSTWPCRRLRTSTGSGEWRECSCVVIACTCWYSLLTGISGASSHIYMYIPSPNVSPRSRDVLRVRYIWYVRRNYINWWANHVKALPQPSSHGSAVPRRPSHFGDDGASLLGRRLRVRRSVKASKRRDAGQPRLR